MYVSHRHFELQESLEHISFKYCILYKINVRLIEVESLTQSHTASQSQN
jgi:hypothetical protein